MNKDKVNQVKEVLKTVIDPELGVNIWDLGLVYSISVSDSDEVYIAMTLTSPNCPFIDTLPAEVEDLVGVLDWVLETEVELIWEPKWHTGMVSEDLQVELGLI
jgi:metal-sulfur cluster biosynthetic enzyme